MPDNDCRSDFDDLRSLVICHSTLDSSARVNPDELPAGRAMITIIINEQ